MKESRAFNAAWLSDQIIVVNEDVSIATTAFLMDFKDLGLEYRSVRLQSVAVFCKVLCSEDKSTTVGVIFPFVNQIFSSSGNGYSEGLIQGHLCVNMY